jgi:hypothetical protein
MPKAKDVRGRYFAIKSSICERLYELGVNAAVAYLVLACGTDRDNRINRMLYSRDRTVHGKGSL